MKIGIVKITGEEIYYLNEILINFIKNLESQLEEQVKMSDEEIIMREKLQLLQLKFQNAIEGNKYV